MAVQREANGRERLAADSADRFLADMYERLPVARPSLLTGVASLFDFAGVFAPRVPASLSARTDAEALAAAWEAVGRDMWRMFPDDMEMEEPEAAQGDRDC